MFFLASAEQQQMLEKHFMDITDPREDNNSKRLIYHLAILVRKINSFEGRIKAVLDRNHYYR